MTTTIPHEQFKFDVPAMGCIEARTYYFYDAESRDEYAKLFPAYKESRDKIDTIAESPAYKELEAKLPKLSITEAKLRRGRENIREYVAEMFLDNVRTGRASAEYNTYDGRIETNIRPEVFEVMKKNGLSKTKLNFEAIRRFVNELISADCKKSYGKRLDAIDEGISKVCREEHDVRKAMDELVKAEERIYYKIQGELNKYRYETEPIEWIDRAKEDAKAQAKRDKIRMAENPSDELVQKCLSEIQALIDANYPKGL